MAPAPRCSFNDLTKELKRTQRKSKVRSIASLRATASLRRFIHESPTVDPILKAKIPRTSTSEDVRPSIFAISFTQDSSTDLSGSTATPQPPQPSTATASPSVPTVAVTAPTPISPTLRPSLIVTQTSPRQALSPLALTTPTSTLRAARNELEFAAHTPSLLSPARRVAPLLIKRMSLRDTKEVLAKNESVMAWATSTNNVSELQRKIVEQQEQIGMTDHGWGDGCGTH